MSQGNWGGGGQGGGGQGGGYGPPPGGGGYGPPPGGGGYGPPPGGGGYGPPPGGGGYGPPPGGGGYGPPPGGGGYGPPGGGGYGPPPGGAPPGGYGAPPAAYGPPPMGAPGATGTRVRFDGDGGKLFATYLLYSVAPIFGVMFIFAAITGVGALLDEAIRAQGAIAGVFGFFGGLLMMGGLAFSVLLFLNKFFEFYYENLFLDGQPCRYVGTLGGLLKVGLINLLLISLTFGIYTPWAIVKVKQWSYENVEVGGQRGRLSFHGDGGSLLGTYILGAILTYCTLGIYGAWFANDIFAFLWENSRIDGRPFGFKKDPGGFLGAYILTMLLSYCTCGIYYPWGICNILKWEAERVT